MNRDVPLSPSEEITLRRVHYGIAQASEMIPHHVEHLTQLALVEKRGPRLLLTEIGRQRVARLPTPDQQLIKLMAFITRADRGTDRPV